MNAGMARGGGSRASSRRGLALALVTLHSTLMLSAWALANRETVDLVRLKAHAASRETSRGHREAAARRLALGYALALLETGVPPSSPYVAAFDVDAGPAPGDAMTFVLEFTEIGGGSGEGGPPPTPGAESRWSVRVRRDAAGAPGSPRPWRFDPPPEADDDGVPADDPAAAT